MTWIFSKQWHALLQDPQDVVSKKVLPSEASLLLSHQFKLRNVMTSVVFFLLGNIECVFTLNLRSWSPVSVQSNIIMNPSLFIWKFLPNSTGSGCYRRKQTTVPVWSEDLPQHSEFLDVAERFKVVSFSLCKCYVIGCLLASFGNESHSWCYWSHGSLGQSHMVTSDFLYF